MSPNSEADTCRKYVVPKLTDAGWDDEPHFIAGGPVLRPVVTHIEGLQTKVNRLNNRLQQKTATDLDAIRPSILTFKGEL